MLMSVEKKSDYPEGSDFHNQIQSLKSYMLLGLKSQQMDF